MELKSAPQGWQALCHRWFIQYNPLYLVSASLVLVGVFFTSVGLSTNEGHFAELWLTGITELYQVMLIAGAALLYRIGQRRPAVMLALLEAIYICDLTFQTSVSPVMGGIGVAASLVWFMLFLVKLRALAWAVKIEAPRATWMLLSLGGAALAGLPHLLYAVSGQSGDLALILCAFSLASAGLWCEREIRSRHALDSWGDTVLRRIKLAGWPLWGALLMGHMIWWSMERPLPASPLAADPDSSGERHAGAPDLSPLHGSSVGDTPPPARLRQPAGRADHQLAVASGREC